MNAYTRSHISDVVTANSRATRRRILPLNVVATVLARGWPEKRAADSVLGDKGVGLIQRTTATSWLRVPPGFVPSFLNGLQTPLNWVFPGMFNDQGELRIGPIPAGAPINLLGNFDLLPEERGLTAGVQRLWALLGIAARLRHDMAAMPPNVDDATAMRIFAPLARRMYDLGTCPDYVVNRGHYFGTDRFAEEPALSDADKRALIEFLKTF